MTRDDSDELFDPDQIFIGREQQIDHFNIYLNRWKQFMFNADPDDTLVTIAPSPQYKIQGLIILLYGRGGFGKSTLLQHYHEIARQNSRNLVVSKIVDWEFAVEGKRGIFALSQGQEIDASEYYRVLCGQLAIALEKKPKEFREYQLAVKDVEQARKQISGVLDSLQRDDRYAALRGVTIDALMTMIGTLIPGSASILENDKARAMVNQGVTIGIEQLAHVRSKLHNELGEKLGDYLDAPLRLGLALGRDLHEFAKNFPVLIFFDTYEEVASADYLLRTVMGGAGLRVGWVLAGRDNLWAGSEQRKRSIAKEYGYKEIVLTDRALAVDFNVGGVGGFTASDIKDYFDQLCQRALYEPPLPIVTEDQATLILDITQGIPLAVNIAAGLYIETADVELVTEHVDNQRKIVDQMVERYLLHAHDAQSERAKLYGLAMLRRADQPSAISAALNLTPEQAENSYERELSRLHRRYSFVFTEKQLPSLHQEVRSFLRLWLREKHTEPEIVAISKRLINASQTLLEERVKQNTYSTLQARFEDEKWMNLYLDLTEQQFWLDPMEGVRYALPFMIAAAVNSPSVLQEIADIGQFFETKMEAPCAAWWHCAITSLSYRGKWPAFKLETDFLERMNKLSVYKTPNAHELEKLINIVFQQQLGFPPPVTIGYDKVEAILFWLLGDIYKRSNKYKALEWYEKALSRLNQETKLKEAVVITCWNIASELIEEHNSGSLPFLNRAIELKPGYAAAYNSRGITYHHLKQHDQALQDYTQAIILDPKDTRAYNNRGITYNDLKQYDQALQDYTQAIILDPKHAKAYYGRGITYNDLKQYDQALQDYTQAIALNPKYADAYYGRGITYYHLKQYDQALQDYTQAIVLDPKHASAYCNRGYTHLSLRDVQKALVDYSYSLELNPNQCTAAWMIEWIKMGKERADLETVKRLDAIAARDPQHHYAYVCRGVALGLCGQLKGGLTELDEAIPLFPQLGDIYFWKGMLCAYYYQGRYGAAVEMIKQSLTKALPPILLTPLYWLEKDRPDFFQEYARPLLDQYGL